MITCNHKSQITNQITLQMSPATNTVIRSCSYWCIRLQLQSSAVPIGTDYNHTSSRVADDSSCTSMNKNVLFVVGLVSNVIARINLAFQTIPAAGASARTYYLLIPVQVVACNVWLHVLFELQLRLRQLHHTTQCTCTART